MKCVTLAATIELRGENLPEHLPKRFLTKVEKELRKRKPFLQKSARK